MLLADWSISTSHDPLPSSCHSKKMLWNPSIHIVLKAATWATICDHPKIVCDCVTTLLSWEWPAKSVTVWLFFLFAVYGTMISFTYTSLWDHTSRCTSKYSAYWNEHPLSLHLSRKGIKSLGMKSSGSANCVIYYNNSSSIREFCDTIATAQQMSFVSHSQTRFGLLAFCHAAGACWRAI